MKQPILVVMAAGMGSRYGGLKQVDGVGPQGEMLIDYSLYDAQRAGFARVVFIIREENRALFEEKVVAHLPKTLSVELAAQELADVPAGFVVPATRTKPWGTAQAIWAARHVIDAPFAVINADDYYGPTGFVAMAEFLSKPRPAGEYTMIAYPIRNTLTEHGSVSRGICEVSDDGFLRSVTERTEVYADGADAKYTEDGGATFHTFSGNTPCSMNFWGFQTDFVEATGEEFARFLKEEWPLRPEKAECYLPTVVTRQLEKQRARVHMRYSEDAWFGMTYPQDRAEVGEKIKARIEQGVYPAQLW